MCAVTSRTFSAEPRTDSFMRGLPRMSFNEPRRSCTSATASLTFSSTESTLVSSVPMTKSPSFK